MAELPGILENILQISWEYPLKISKEFHGLPLQVALEARSSLLRPSIAALVRAMKISSRRIHQSSSQIELPKGYPAHKKFVKINGGPNLDSLLRSDLLLRHSTWCSATCAIHAVLTASEKRERSVNSGGGAWLVLSWCCMVLRGRKSNQLQVNPGAFTLMRLLQAINVSVVECPCQRQLANGWQTLVGGKDVGQVRATACLAMHTAHDVLHSTSINSELKDM